MALLESLLEAVFPTRCAGCDLPGAVLCPECRARIAAIRPKGACVRCGAPYGHIVCTECWDTEFSFSAARCVGLLERPLSRCVTVFKDADERRLAAVFAEMLVASAGEWVSWAECFEVVPATQAAVRRRGYDHMRIIGEEFARQSGVSLLGMLEACETRDLRGLGRAERRTMTKEAFSVRSGVSAPQRVLVLDDVLTTGATVNAASQALILAGASDVRICTLARVW